MLTTRIVSICCLLGLAGFLVAGVTVDPASLPYLDLSAPSLLLGCFILTMGWLVAAYSARNLRGQSRQGRFGLLLAVAVVALWLVVVAQPLLVIAAAWTASGLAVAGLVGHAATPQARRAARSVATRLVIGDIALWLAVILLLSGGVSMRSDVTQAWWGVAALLAVAGVVRSALVPAWRWLPLTAEAPSPVSALLHAGVVNGLGLLAIVFWPVFRGAPAVLIALIVIGLATVVLAAAAMRLRPDVKGRLASSTSAQMGYMAVQIGLGLPAFAMLHLVGHGFYKAWLFLRAGGAPRRAQVPVVNLRPVVALPAGAGVLAVVALGVMTWTSFTVVELIPLLAAGFSALMAIAMLLQPDQRTSVLTSSRGRVLGALTVLAGLLGYVAFLGLWAKVFELPWVWTGAAAVYLTIATAAAAAIGLWAAGTGRLWRVVQGAVIDPRVRVRGSVGAMELAPSQGCPELVDVAGKVVGKMWPLESAVAVNPMHDLQELDFMDAARIAAETWGARTFLPEAEYFAALRAGRFTEADLIAASSGFPVPDDRVAQYLQARVQWRPNGTAAFLAEHLLRSVTDEELGDLLPGPRSGVLTMAELAGKQTQAEGLANAWTALLIGQPELWAGFQNRVQDLGLRGLSRTVKALPSDPGSAISSLLDRTVPTEVQIGYLSRLLAQSPGWAAHIKHRDSSRLRDLIAIRVTFDVLVARAMGVPAWRPAPRPDPRAWASAQVAPVVDLLNIQDPLLALELARSLDEPGRLAIWQRAWEQRYRNRLVDRVTTRAAQSQHEPAARADAQMVMCIDVRSERMRRHAEASGNLQTYGFAGFFGLPIRHETASGEAADQCPVLLTPSYLITEDDSVSGLGLPQVFRQALSGASAVPGGAFAVAEALGVLAGVDAVAQTAAPGVWGRLRDRMFPAGRGQLHIDRLADGLGDGRLQWGIGVEERTDMAATMLRALGIVEGFSDVLLLVGHAATVENNAFAAAYDCGACGGHGGHVNARIMAAILNDPGVRRGLRTEHGLDLPDSTVAIPAWHNTTTDAITIDQHDVPASHATAVASLETALRSAQRAALDERLAELPGSTRSTRAAASARASDWAQPQPEWGLAGNAAFVIGPRSFTRGLNLRGRVFLHSYEPGLDVDGSILETLLTAPMQVTQWINNQYYFSTVDPVRFGAGDKTTHNVVGGIGVLTGASGDLRVGLPWQALSERQPGCGGRWQHEPLRLMVLVYAAREDISRVFDEHPDVARLVTNEWISLAAIDPADHEAYALGTDLTWRPWLVEEKSRRFEESH